VFEHEQCTSFSGKIWQIWRAGCFAEKMMPQIDECFSNFKINQTLALLTEMRTKK
jgi:hypothetical protein